MKASHFSNTAPRAGVYGSPMRPNTIHHMQSTTLRPSSINIRPQTTQIRSLSSRPKPQGNAPIDSPSAINPAKRPVKATKSKSPQQQRGSKEIHNVGGISSGKKKASLTEVVKQSDEQQKARKFNMDELFKHSKMGHIFSGEMNHPSFFSRLEDGDTVYLNGTRRVTDLSGHSETNYSMIARTIDKTRRALIDRVIAYDYESELPFEQHLTTQIDEALSTATAVDRDLETGQPISRSFIRLRGDPWRWHSAVSISKIEPHLDPTMSQEYLDSLPETTMISRIKFTENGLIGEKVVKHHDDIVFTIVDDLRITTAKAWNDKCDKIFDESKKRLSAEFEQMVERDGRAEKL